MRPADIALTVSGVIATMALAFFIYREQQKSAAAVLAATQAAPDYQTQGLYDASMAYQYTSQLPSVSVPAISTSQTANVDTSSSTAATGNTDTTDIDSIFSQILSTFHDAVATSSGGAQTSTPPPASVDFSDYSIPLLDIQPVISTAGIPTTASDAQQQAEAMLPPDSTPPAPVASPISTAPILCPGGSGSGYGCGNVFGLSGGLTDTSTAATPAPSNQPVATTTSPIHNMHVMANQIAQSI